MLQSAALAVEVSPLQQGVKVLADLHDKTEAPIQAQLPTPEAPAQILPGQIIRERYRIVRLLGRGGMGEVYLARDPVLKRDVALKVLPAVYARDAETLARFEQEAQVLAALDHGNIAAIHDLVTLAQNPCLVLQFIDGQTLEERLATGPLTLPALLPIFRQIAAALDAAHRAGIVHRDLKPANIKLTPQGTVKVLDFGIAKLLKDAAPAPRLLSPIGAESTTIKETLFSDEGKIIGTPPYMSPEQFAPRGQAVDQRLDIWAFGCVLYEALTGRLAFPGNDIYEIAQAVFNSEPDWQALPPDTPTRIRELLRQCLEKDPQRRISSAAELWRRLDAVGRAGGQATEIVPITSPSAPPKPPAKLVNRTLAGLAGLAAVGMVLLGWQYTWQHTRQSPIPAQKYLTIAPFKQVAAPAENKIFVDGLLRRLSENLAQVPGLQVLSQRPPAPDTETRWIVDHLGATLILRGTVQQSASQTLISYTLVNAQNAEISKDAVNHPDLLVALSRLSAQVAQVLGLTPPAQPPTDAPLTGTPQEQYLTALGLLEKAQEEEDEPSVTRAIGLLGQVVNQPIGNQPRYWAALGHAYLIKYQLAHDKSWLGQASNVYDQTPVQDQGRQEIQFMQGQTNLALGRYPDAAKNFQAVIQQRPDNVTARLSLAETYVRQQQFGAAEQTYRQAIALAPGFWPAYNEFGNYFFEHGRYHDAAEQWQQVIRLVPSQDDGHTNLGNAYFYQANFEAALAAYNQSLSIRQTPEAYGSQGTALYFLGKYDEARDAFNKGLALDAGHPVLLGNLGDAYRQLRNTDQANLAYDQAIQNWKKQLVTDDSGQVTNAAGLAKLAELQAKRGQAQQAKNNINRALMLEPENLECMTSAILVYLLTGQRQLALDWASQAVRHGYSRALLKAEPELAPLRDDPQFKQLGGS